MLKTVITYKKNVFHSERINLFDIILTSENGI